ncbi:hypothetical protein Ddc_16993 [Ditylenchus destructor]|nr:hypothetical protein Ddc_16993 [Ditylenchus destructor]
MDASSIIQQTAENSRIDAMDKSNVTNEEGEDVLMQESGIASTQLDGSNNATAQRGGQNSGKGYFGKNKKSCRTTDSHTCSPAVPKIHLPPVPQIHLLPVL